MALKVARRADLTLETELVPGCTVTVRYLTRAEREELLRKCERTVRDRTGRLVKEPDDKLYLQYAPDAYLAGLKLRPEALVELGILVEEEPEVDEDGYIPDSPDLRRQVWAEADGSKFAAAIIDLASDLAKFVQKCEADTQKN